MKKELIAQYKEMAKGSPRNMEDCIKKHLEELAATNPAFAQKYDKKRFKDCISFVISCAREILASKSGEVADDICYKMARDYFEESLWTEEKAKKAEPEETEKEVEKAHEVVPEKKLKKPEPVAEQMDLFGGV